MAGVGEAWPQGEDIPDFDPELQERTRFSNFKALLEVCRNLEDEEEISPDASYFAYQKYLKSDPTGKAIAEAIRLVWSKPENARLVHLASFYLHSSDSRGDDVYQEVADRTVEHLPPGLGIEILLDPHAHDQAA